MKAIVINKFGGPEVMEYTTHKEPIAGKDQFVVDVKIFVLV